MMHNESYINLFEKYLSKAGLDISLNKSRALVNRYITAEFARQLFGENQYYQIILKEDKMVKTVLKN
jgi:carboxyl-terminal processing protease